MATSGKCERFSFAATAERDGAAFAGNFGNPLADLSTTLATLIPQATAASRLGGNYLADALPTMRNDVLVTVYQIGGALLSQPHGLAGLDLAGADMVIINVFGGSAAVPNLNLFSGASAVFWNFADAPGIAPAAAFRQDPETRSTAPFTASSARNGQAGS